MRTFFADKISAYEYLKKINSIQIKVLRIADLMISAKFAKGSVCNIVQEIWITSSSPEEIYIIF